MSFATELDRLIHKFVGRPTCGEDFQEVMDALHEACNRVAIEADRYRWRDETEREFRRRVGRTHDDCWG
jgi:hypothetical protein